MARARKPTNRKAIKDLSPAYKKRQEAAARRAGMTLSRFRASKERMRAARGHKQEAAERKERRERARREHGVSIERLSKLRREVFFHVLETWRNYPTEKSIEVDTIRANARRMSVKTMRHILTLDAQGFREFSWEDVDYDYGDMPNDHLPIWYGPVSYT